MLLLSNQGDFGECSGNSSPLRGSCPQSRCDRYRAESLTCAKGRMARETIALNQYAGALNREKRRQHAPRVGVAIVAPIGSVQIAAKNRRQSVSVRQMKLR
jgi:hypothetical protein